RGDRSEMQYLPWLFRRVRCVSPRPPRSSTPVQKSDIYGERLILTGMAQQVPLVVIWCLLQLDHALISYTLIISKTCYHSCMESELNLKPIGRIYIHLHLFYKCFTAFACGRA
ncbi:MAG: hypothetical protein J7502_20000, partial [Flavisolibacter sp.]|nr:hypothetical protein [Flavisolibacter sp.]